MKVVKTPPSAAADGIFTLISKAMLPTGVRIETVVALLASCRWTRSPLRRAEYDWAEPCVPAMAITTATIKTGLKSDIGCSVIRRAPVAARRLRALRAIPA